jgi:hypothetical protein
MGLLPNEIEDPYPDTVEYFTSIEEKMRKQPGQLPPFSRRSVDCKQPSAVPLSRSDASFRPRTRPSKS